MAFPRGGYLGKILRVDLSRSLTSEQVIDHELLRHYVGGTGLGIRLLYDELETGTDAFSAESPLIYTTGPLTGTLVPGSGTYTVTCKNALTGLVAVTQANGFFGARLKNAGYDAVIIHGKAPNPVYLHIHDGGAEILDASALSGKTTWETDVLLRRKHGEPGFEDRISVAAIGPAGEHLVRFASIVSDRGHVAATGGAGAVMGSKNLKAIVAHGQYGVPVDRSRAEEFFRLCRKWREESANTSMGKAVTHHGTLGWFTPYHSRGWVPIKNLTTNLLTGEERFQADRIRGKLYKMQPRVCHGCTFHHCHVVKVTRGKYKGTVAEEPEYEIMAGFGPNWGIGDPGAVAFLNGLNDGLGMDAKEVTFLVSMIMEGAEKGLLGAEGARGAVPRWGDVEGAADLLRRISRREGLGDVLSQGVMRAANHLGGAFPEMAVYVKKGCAPHIHDPRTRWGTLFNQVISNMGSQEGIDMTMRFSTELGLDRPASEPDEYVGVVQSKTGPKRQFEECLGFCYFQSCSIQTMADTLNCITGTGFDVQDCLTVGRRIINLMRMLGKREGMTREDDSFSPRLAQSPTDGPQAGKSLAPNFEKIRQAYYESMGWDEEGMPTASTLRDLGLDFTING
jgi:aldehyde:ferredoxin oxidoreductase